MKKQPDQTNSRRQFLGMLAAGSAAISLPKIAMAESAAIAPKEAVSIHVFSKHLQFLDYDEMAEAAAEVGFDGVDLAVRPGGHVLPEKVKTDLPKAVQAIKKQGLQAKLMTTAIIDSKDALNKNVLSTAAEQGIQYYRTNWLRYPEQAKITEFLKECRQKLSALAKYNQQLGLYGGYQNHAGARYVGAPVWDIAGILHEINSPYMGNQYDIRHATVEGGEAWPLGLQYIHPHINTLVIKDFRWEEKDGKWRVVNTPLGEGMVDFAAFFSQLKALGISAPISLHYEYPLPENDKSLSEKQKVEQTILVMKKDLDTLKKYLKESGMV